MTERARTEEQVFRTVRQWWRAWIERDRRAIDRLAHPAYDETDETGHFRSLCRDDVLAAVEERGRRAAIERWHISQPSVHRVGRLVMCNYAFDIEVRHGDHLVGLKGRASDILIEQGSELLYLSHSGSLSPSSDRAPADVDAEVR